MSTVDPQNPFHSYKMTDDESFQSHALSLQQEQGIQNLLAMYAIQKMNLKFTPNDVNTFLQAEAELQGKIGVLREILDLSDVARQHLVNQAQRNQSPR